MANTKKSPYTEKTRLVEATDITSIPLQGGCNTSIHKALIPFGRFSMLQNARGKHPGFEKRPGQIKLHPTADSTNEILSLYQFRKNRIDEKHFFAQMADGDILDAATAPPGIAGTVFGAEVFSGSASQIPAAWSVIDDILFHSNGVDQHKTYTGNDNYITALVKFDGSAAPKNIPEMGLDYTMEATDGLTTTVVVLDALNTYAAFECVFICTPVPATKLTWTISAANGTSSVATLYYRKSDNTWADTSMTDGTISPAGKTLGATGSMTWTAPTDEIPMFMYGQSGFWYQLRVSVQLDAEVEVSKITFGSGFHDLVNVWDGVIPYAIEAMFYDQSVTAYKTYATGSIELDNMVHETVADNDDRDRLYFNSADPIMGIYVDVGVTPNLNATAIIKGVKVWTGAAFTTVGTITDGTNGLKNSGWITWPRISTAQPTQFQTVQYYSYWYYLWIGTATLSADIIVSLLTMPYFDIEELGHGQCNCVWKERVVTSYTLWPNYLYVTADARPLALNGNDFGYIVAGDGRRNKVAAIRKFHNELVAWQEEKGHEGGTVTLFQGFSPVTFGKLLISSRIGTMNNKCVAVVDGVLTSTRTDEEVKDLIFFLSRYGVCVTDGMTITVVSDDIQNYFDPTKAECIRRGYESKMWLVHDSAFNIIRIGLVSGSSAIVPNIFPVFDLVDKSWSFDVLAQELSHMAEIEADSGAIHTIQVGGGVDDGTVYLLNSGDNDISTAIDSYATVELNAGGEYIQLNEMMIRTKAQTAANTSNLTITLYKNSVSAGTKTLSMTEDISGNLVKRHRFNLNLCDQNLSVKIQHNTASKECELLDLGLRTDLFKER